MPAAVRRTHTAHLPVSSEVNVMDDDAGMATTISPDGTTVAHRRSGQGRPLVLVHGTTADHTRWRTVLPLLEPHATLFAVDRRGRGASGDAAQYAIEREFADVAAVVDAVADAHGPVDLLGHSFGALCALEAALLTRSVRRLVLYEPPVLAPPRSGTDDRLRALLAEDRGAEVVETFFREIVGMPRDQLDLIRSLPSWPARVAAAHTVLRERLVDPPYRFDPARFAALGVPTLLLGGADSPPFVQESTHAVAAAIPGSRVVRLEGQQHVAMDSAPELFAATVLDFLREPVRTGAHPDPQREEARS
jgi:pimeloyl-ACP methyl ester carboxylesterase